MARKEARRGRSSPATPRPESVELRSGDPEHGGFPIAPVRPPVADRRLPLAAVLVVALIGLAVVKPWATPGDEAARSGPADPRPAPSVVDTSSPTPGPTPDTAADLAGPVCLGAGGWEIASLETWRDHDVRVWRAVDPIGQAAGPLDPRIPTAPAVGLEIRALGWCAPAYGPDRPVGPAQVTAWIVIDGVAHELELRQILPEEGATYLAAVYVPVAPCPLGTTCPRSATRSVTQPWPSGRVVFRYEDLGGRTTTWFGADAMLSTEPGVTP
jgi:hypothetical protein